MIALGTINKILPSWPGSPPTVECPSCETGIRIQTGECPVCGDEIAVECRDCGKTIETEIGVCPECGGRDYTTFLLE